MLIRNDARFVFEKPMWPEFTKFKCGLFLSEGDSKQQVASLKGVDKRNRGGIRGCINAI